MDLLSTYRHGPVGKIFPLNCGNPAVNTNDKDSCLVIVDAQNEYAHELLAISNVQASRAAIGQVLKKYRDAEGDIVHVKHVTPDGVPVSCLSIPQRISLLHNRQIHKVPAEYPKLGVLARYCACRGILRVA